ncbi:unnamed protein product [Caenorhabditis brenneri]
MSSKEAITDFHRAVLKAYQCASQTVSLAESRVIGRLLKLNWIQVRDWFWKNRNKEIAMPDVTPETQKSIDEIIKVIKTEINGIFVHHEQPHSPRKRFQLNVLETRFRQGSRITSLECHLIGQQFELEGETITNWFRNRRRSKQEADSNFVMSPKALELLEVINKEVKKQRHFNMTLSQGNCLGKRYSISPSLSREERITMSKTIGVPEYWIKWWFAKRNKLERRRKERAATGSGKERRSERTTEPSSASEPSEVQSMSSSEDWFEKLATFPSTSEKLLPLDPFSTPTSTQFTTSLVDATISCLGNQSFPSERSSASEPSSVQSVSDSEDWFEKMETAPTAPELFLPVDPFSTPTSAQFTTSPVHATSSVFGNQSFPCSSSDARNSRVPEFQFRENWEFQDGSSAPVEMYGNKLPSVSHAGFPAHQKGNPSLPRSETVSNAHGWTFQHHEMCPNSSNNRFPKPSIDWNYQRDNNYPVAQQQDPDQKMSGVFYFNQFQLDLLHTRLSSKKPVTKEEAGAIAKLLEVEKKKVYAWFHNKPVLKTPQVDLKTRVKIELILSEASKETDNYHGTRRIKGPRLERLLEIYLSGSEFNMNELAKELGMTPKQVDRWFRNQKRKGVPDKRRRKQEFEKHKQIVSQLKSNHTLKSSDGGENTEGVSEESMANSDDWFSRMETMPSSYKIFDEDCSTNYFLDHALPTSNSEYQDAVSPSQEFQFQPMDQEPVLDGYGTTFETANTYVLHSTASNFDSDFTPLPYDPTLNQIWPSDSENSSDGFINSQSMTVSSNFYGAAHYPTTDYHHCLPPLNQEWSSLVHHPYNSTEPAPTVTDEYQNHHFEI